MPGTSTQFFLQARTGAIVTIGPGQLSGNHLSTTAPANNEEICANIGLMLMSCAVGDILAWSLILAGLLCSQLGGGGATHKHD